MRTSSRSRLSRRFTTPVTLLVLAATAGLTTASPASATAGTLGATVTTTATATTTTTTTTTRALGRIEAQARHTQTKVIVRAAPGSLAAVADAVKKLNGQVSRVLPVINGLAATVPVTAVAKLQADRRVLSVTPDPTGTLQSVNQTLAVDRRQPARTGPETGRWRPVRPIGPTRHA